MELVSVIIPTYNRYQKLHTAVASVYDQSYQGKIEIIIVDDCSTQKEYELLITIYSKMNHQNRKILCLKTEKNTGCPTEPRNIGLRNCRGDYICFLDDDDYFMPNKIETQVNQLRENKELAGCCSDAITGDNILHHGQRFLNEVRKRYNDKIPSILSIADFVSDNWLILSSLMIRREIFNRVGFFIPWYRTLEKWEDYNYIKRIVALSLNSNPGHEKTSLYKIYYSHEPTLFYTIGKQEEKWHYGRE